MQYFVFTPNSVWAPSRQRSMLPGLWWKPNGKWIKRFVNELGSLSQLARALPLSTSQREMGMGIVSERKPSMGTLPSASIIKGPHVIFLDGSSASPNAAMYLWLALKQAEFSTVLLGVIHPKSTLAPSASPRMSSDVQAFIPRSPFSFILAFSKETGGLPGASLFYKPISCVMSDRTTSW